MQSEFERSMRELVTAPGVSREEAQEAVAGLMQMAETTPSSSGRSLPRALAAAEVEGTFLNLYGPDPRPFLRPAMDEIAPELLARFQDEFAKAMANITEHKVWCPICGEYVPMSALEEHECDEGKLANHKFTGLLGAIPDGAVYGGSGDA